MPNCRTLCALAVGVLAIPGFAWGQELKSRTVFYASPGPTLTLDRINVDDAAGTDTDRPRRGEVRGQRRGCNRASPVKHRAAS
jgi:hypothetical protein